LEMETLVERLQVEYVEEALTSEARSIEAIFAGLAQKAARRMRRMRTSMRRGRIGQ